MALSPVCAADPLLCPNQPCLPCLLGCLLLHLPLRLPSFAFVLQLSEIDVPALGPQFETNSVFPKKTNTHFVEVLDKGHVRVSVWERGAGQTLACGTGACAIVVAGVLEGQTDRKCQVDLPGGPLIIEWRENDNHIYMTGPAELAFRGVTEV